MFPSRYRSIFVVTMLTGSAVGARERVRRDLDRGRDARQSRRGTAAAELHGSGLRERPRCALARACPALHRDHVPGALRVVRNRLPLQHQPLERLEQLRGVREGLSDRVRLPEPDVGVRERDVRAGVRQDADRRRLLEPRRLQRGPRGRLRDSTSPSTRTTAAGAGTSARPACPASTASADAIPASRSATASASTSETTTTTVVRAVTAAARLRTPARRRTTCTTAAPTTSAASSASTTGGNWANCDNNLANGCEVLRRGRWEDLTGDPNNCGKCGKKCAANQVCTDLTGTSPRSAPARTRRRPGAGASRPTTSVATTS